MTMNDVPMGRPAPKPPEGSLLDAVTDEMTVVTLRCAACHGWVVEAREVQRETIGDSVEVLVIAGVCLRCVTEIELRIRLARRYTVEAYRQQHDLNYDPFDEERARDGQELEDEALTQLGLIHAELGQPSYTTPVINPL